MRLVGARRGTLSHSESIGSLPLADEVTEEEDFNTEAQRTLRSAAERKVWVPGSAFDRFEILTPNCCPLSGSVVKFRASCLAFLNFYCTPCQRTVMKWSAPSRGKGCAGRKPSSRIPKNHKPQFTCSFPSFV